LTVKTRRQYLGCVVFVAELYKIEGVLNTQIITRVQHGLMVEAEGKDVPQQDIKIEALNKWMATLGGWLTQTRSAPHKSLIDDGVACLTRLSTDKRLSLRLRFACRDTLDMQERGWQARREEAKAMKLDDFKREAKAKEAEAEAAARQAARNDRRGGGRRGDRDDRRGGGRRGDRDDRRGGGRDDRGAGRFGPGSARDGMRSSGAKSGGPSTPRGAGWRRSGSAVSTEPQRRLGSSGRRDVDLSREDNPRGGGLRRGVSTGSASSSTSAGGGGGGGRRETSAPTAAPLSAEEIKTLLNRFRNALEEFAGLGGVDQEDSKGEAATKELFANLDETYAEKGKSLDVCRTLVEAAFALTHERTEEARKAMPVALYVLASSDYIDAKSLCAGLRAACSKFDEKVEDVPRLAEFMASALTDVLDSTIKSGDLLEALTPMRTSPKAAELLVYIQQQMKPSQARKVQFAPWVCPHPAELPRVVKHMRKLDAKLLNHGMAAAADINRSAWEDVAELTSAVAAVAPESASSIEFAVACIGMVFGSFWAVEGPEGFAAAVAPFKEVLTQVWGGVSGVDNRARLLLDALMRVGVAEMALDDVVCHLFRVVESWGMVSKSDIDAWEAWLNAAASDSQHIGDIKEAFAAYRA
jgi:hypothetical protein